MSKNPDAPLTRLPNLAFISDEGSNLKALNTPNLSPDEIAAIPVSDELKGAIVFDHLTEELLTFTAAGFWLPILTAESDITVDIVTATTGNFDIINCNTINNANTINTTSLIVSGVSNLTSGGVSGAWGVNGALTAGSIGSIGNLTVDGATVLQGVTIDGNLTVMGNTILDNVSAATMDVNDFEANTARIDSLLYGQSLNTGVSPITVALDVAAGTGATYAMTGSNLGGTFRLNTGTSPALAGNVIATFTIPVGLLPYLNADWSVIFMPASATTALYTTTSNIYVNTNTGGNQFFIATSALPLAASTSYYWKYILVGNILGT